MTNDHHVPACCRVCGLEQAEPPWGKDGRSPTHAICDCCGVEFGYEDALPAAADAFRAAWVKQGMPWFNPAKKPTGWNASRQLARARPGVSAEADKTP